MIELARPLADLQPQEFELFEQHDVADEQGADLEVVVHPAAHQKNGVKAYKIR